MDHIGNPLVFPSSTKMYVGLMEPIGKGYPIDSNGQINSDEITGHKWEQICKGSRDWKPVGAFERALDWFGDGSLYLLDAPGHMPGHLAAMVRTTYDPPTYLISAGDAAHDLCLFHPWEAGKDERKLMGLWGPGFNTKRLSRRELLLLDPL
jgi:glyoxylase-like metal-dependent hydrolase (beta-lactamase superfamily II)